MKVALILSGQPRAVSTSLQLLKEAVIDPNNISDIFIHSWFNPNDVGKPYSSAQSSQTNRVGLVKPNTDKILVETLQPKKYIIEPQKNFSHLNHLSQDSSALAEHLCSAFYSTYMANELRKQQEQETGIKYDVIIRTRIDLYYYKPIIIEDYKPFLDQLIVSARYQRDQDLKCNKDMPMVDTFAFTGNSSYMDAFCGVYPNYENLCKQVTTRFGENLLGIQVRVNNKVPIYQGGFNYEILHRIAPDI